MANRTTMDHTGPVCPHCGHWHQPDEAFFFDEDTTEMRCYSCDETFNMSVLKTFTWTCTSRAERSGPKGGSE